MKSLESLEKDAVNAVKDILVAKDSRRESSLIEFKENYSSGPMQRFAKSLASFANNKGGAIIFGVKDRPVEVCGLTAKKFNEDSFREVFNNHFFPEVEWHFTEKEVSGHRVGFLCVEEASSKPVICTKTYSDEIVDGKIYYRYRGNNLDIRSADLIGIIEKRLYREIMSITEKISVVASVGSANSAILDLEKGSIQGQGGVLYMEQQLLDKVKFIKSGNFNPNGRTSLRVVGDVKPIHVVASDDPSAAKVSINEENFRALTPHDTEAVMNILSKKIPDFKRSKEFYRLWKIHKSKEEGKTAYHRRLNPRNLNEEGRWWFSDRFIELIIDNITKN